MKVQGLGQRVVAGSRRVAGHNDGRNVDRDVVEVEARLVRGQNQVVVGPIERQGHARGAGRLAVRRHLAAQGHA